MPNTACKLIQKCKACNETLTITDEPLMVPFRTIVHEKHTCFKCGAPFEMTFVRGYNSGFWMPFVEQVSTLEMLAEAGTTEEAP